MLVFKLLPLTLLFRVTLSVLQPVNKFSIKLFSSLYAFENTQNVGVSPISLWNVLSVISEGAAGKTFTELSKVLYLPSNVKDTNDIHAVLKKALRTSSQDVTLNRQSAMFIENKFMVYKDFCNKALKNGAEMFRIDVRNKTRLANDINAYVCQATKGDITDIVKPDMLDDVKILLLDAMFFKANWSYQFDKKLTNKEDFFDENNKKIGEVNMMRRELQVKNQYSTDLKSIIVEIPYGNNKDYSMVIIKPDHRLDTMIEKLSTTPFEDILKKLDNEEESSIEILIPRFFLSSEWDMKKYLQYMGLFDVFDDIKSDLSGISDVPLFVGKVIQKVNIQVKEEGTQASVVTAVTLETRTAQPSLEMNQPFLFMIVNKQFNLILYAGVYQNPSLY